jgi:MYXO-CTERM domain-containing protein
MALNRLSRHFVSAAAVATVVGGANAALVQSSVANLAIPVTSAGVYVNVVTGATSLANFTGADINPWGSTNLGFFNTVSTFASYVRSAGTTGISNLAIGATIGGSSTFSSGTAQTTGTGAFVLNSSNNFVGFRFTNEANGGLTHYGFMQIQLGASQTDSVRKIVGIWYEDVAGVAVTVVPTPGAMALIGLAGLAARRRRR